FIGEKLHVAACSEKRQRADLEQRIAPAQIEAAQGYRQTRWIIEFNPVGSARRGIGQPLINENTARSPMSSGTVGTTRSGGRKLPIPSDASDGNIRNLRAERESVGSAPERIVQKEVIALTV